MPETLLSHILVHRDYKGDFAVPSRQLHLYLSVYKVEVLESHVTRSCTSTTGCISRLSSSRYDKVMGIPKAALWVYGCVES